MKCAGVMNVVLQRRRSINASVSRASHAGRIATVPPENSVVNA